MNNICQGWQILHTSLLITAVLFLVALLLALYYRYKELIDTWLYLICGPGRKDDENKINDVFLSFSHEDEKFVTETLLPELESGPNPFKVCVHYRDFKPGEFIITGVTNSVLSSRKTLIVLSPNYLKSAWSKLEFRTAHTKAMLDGKVRVIVIVYEDIDIKNLDPELKWYLETNTYIKWGDYNFWLRLKGALIDRS